MDKRIAERARNVRDQNEDDIDEINFLIAKMQSISFADSRRKSIKVTEVPASQASKVVEVPASKVTDVTDAKSKSNIFCHSKCGVRLMLRESKGDGDCEFDSVVTIFQNQSNRTTIRDLREICSEDTLDEELNTDYSFLTRFAAQVEERRDERWFQKYKDMNVEQLSNHIPEYRNDMARAILTSDFWGDQYTLNVIAREQDICFLIVDENCTIQHRTDPCSTERIALLHLQNRHYRPIYCINERSKGRQFIFNYQDDCIKNLLRDSKMMQS